MHFYYFINILQGRVTVYCDFDTNGVNNPITILHHNSEKEQQVTGSYNDKYAYKRVLYYFGVNRTQIAALKASLIFMNNYQL